MSSQSSPHYHEAIKDRLVRLESNLARLEAAEKKIKELSRRLETLIANLPGIVYRCRNDPERTMEFVSQACREITGYQPEDLIQNRCISYARLIHPEDRQHVLGQIEKAVEHRVRFQLEYRIFTNRGEQRWLWEQGRPVFGPEGELEAIEGIILDVTAKKQTEAELAQMKAELEQRVKERTAQLHELNQQLRKEIEERQQAEKAARQKSRLLAEALATYEQEHQMLAYEVHDGLAQMISGAILLLEGARSRAADLRNEPNLQRAMDILNRALLETRRLIRGLSPVVAKDRGILDAVSELVEETRATSGIEVELESRVNFERLPAPLESAVFRIVQEALANVCQHSGSPRAVVRLEQKGPWLEILVQDWGRGFDPTAVEADHFGLRGIKKRAEIFGGTCHIDSRPGQGTVVRVQLPITPLDETLQ